MAPATRRLVLAGAVLAVTLLLVTSSVYMPRVRIQWGDAAAGEASNRELVRFDDRREAPPPEREAAEPRPEREAAEPPPTCMPAPTAPAATQRAETLSAAAAASEPLKASDLSLAQTHALFPLHDGSADRQFTLDYYKGVEERKTRFPNQNFAFAMQIVYPPFRIRAPQVDDPADLEEWARKPHQAEKLAETAQWCSGAGSTESALSARLCRERGPRDLIYYQHAFTSGSVDVFENVHVRRHECGWMATPEIARPLQAHEHPQYDKIASLDVPEGCAFQHWLDGILPKIVAALPVIRDPEVKLWVPGCPAGDNVLRLYRQVGIDPARLVQVRGPGVTARRFFSVCDIPGWHPILWRQMRELLGAPTFPKEGQQRTRVLYLPRGQDARNGRTVVNDKEVQDTVRAAAAKYGLEYGEFNARNYASVDALIADLASVRLMVGMHGGAFYNMMFAAAGLDVVEFVPSHVTFFLFHIMADMLGHRHWFLPTSGGTIPADKLGRILDRALASPPPPFDPDA